MAETPHIAAGAPEEQEDVAKATIARLEEQLRRTPKIRRFERGVIRYNLGLAWAEIPSGDRAINLSRAVASLQKAADLFDASSRPVEHARTQNGLGSALRELGQLEEAAKAFRRAVELVPIEISPGEHGAARNNLGLVQSDAKKIDEAVEQYEKALEAFSGKEYVRQRIAVLHNLGQALAGSDDPTRIQGGIDRYLEALDLADPQDHPYQWGLLNHSLGVAHTGTGEPRKAVASFTDSLKVFTRHRWPFQYALAKNNLGLAHAQIGDARSLRQAVVSYEDALRLLDVRMHKEQWEQAYRNLEMAESALKDAGAEGTRAQHFAQLAAEGEGEAVVDLLRERLMDLTTQPEPRRTDALAELDHAVLQLSDEDAEKITAVWMNVLMELPHEQFLAGLRARMVVHGTFDEAAKNRAARVLEQAIGDQLLAPQRIRVRDALEEMGYERPPL